MSDLPTHFCPGCGAPQRAFLRYPWHFCNDCGDTTEDGDGRRLKFANASLSGGLIWRHAGGSDADWSDEAGQVLCLIHGRKVLVREARFGGIVAEPLLSSPVDGLSDWVTDLTRQTR